MKPSFQQYLDQKYQGQAPYQGARSQAQVQRAAQPTPDYFSAAAAALPTIFSGATTGTPAAAGQAATAAKPATDWLGGLFSSGASTPATSAASSSMPALGAAMGQGTTAAQTATPFTWVGGVPTQVGATEAASMASYLPSLTTAAQVGGGLAGAYAMYDAFKNRDDWDDKSEWESGARRGAQVGAGIGTALMPGIGTLAGGAGGALWGTIASQFGGGKGKDQRGRDQMRGDLQSRGIIDDGYNLTLADGNKYDIGRDGSVQNYNVDFSKQGIGDVVGSVNPLAYILANGDKKKATDLAGYYTNAASNSGDANANALNFYKQAGIDRNTAWQSVDKMVQDGKIDQGTGDAFKAGIDKLHGVK